MQDKVAIVTGGGGGIGGATARHLAASGASVAVVDLDASRADSVVAEIRGAGGDAEGFAVDVAHETKIEAMTAAVVARFGHVDVLVNCAALTAFSHMQRDMECGIAEMPADLWDLTMAVNLRGPMLCAKHALRSMIERGGGSIVNISSIGGIQARPTMAAYGVSKAAMHMLTQYIATGYGRSGIRCNTVAPGFTVTEIGLESLSDEDRHVRSRHTVLGRFGEPGDVASMIAYLASDQARAVTGQLIAVDAGVTIHLPWYADQLERGANN